MFQSQLAFVPNNDTVVNLCWYDCQSRILCF